MLPAVPEPAFVNQGNLFNYDPNKRLPLGYPLDEKLEGDLVSASPNRGVTV